MTFVASHTRLDINEGEAGLNQGALNQHDLGTSLNGAHVRFMTWRERYQRYDGEGRTGAN